MFRHALSCLLLVATFAMLNGCAVWGVYEDKRLTDTMTEDKGLASRIKTALMNEKFVDGWSVSVYSYYRNVYLVGEVPGEMQSKAVEIAKKYEPRTVTTHWFTKSKNESSNLALATNLRGALIGTKGLSSTRIDTEVNAGRVVLLGVVGSEREKEIAIEAAKKVKNVTKVTSYLMLPMGAGANSAPQTVNTSAKQGSSGSSGNSGGSGNVESRDI